MNKNSSEARDAQGYSFSTCRWVAWPAAERLPKTAGVVVIISILSLLVGKVGGDWLWGVTSAFVLVLSLNRWFLPTVFEIKMDCLQVGYPLQRRSIEWNRVRRIAIDSRGGWISARRSSSRFGVRDGFDMYWGRAKTENINAIRSVAKSLINDEVPVLFTDHGDDAS